MNPGRCLQRLKKPTNFADMSIIVTSRGAATATAGMSQCLPVLH